MKNFYSNFLFLAIAAIALNSCSSPFKDLDIRVDTNVFQYTTVVEVKSSAGTSLDNATVVLKGDDADKIYNTEGRKNFKVTGGMILLALDPKVTPQEGKPIKFSVAISAPDYLDVNIPVTISKEHTTGLMSATMINTKALPEGVNVKTSTVTLSPTGATAAPVTISTTAGSGVTETVSIALPAGTQFKDAQGNVISGGSLAVSTLVANTSSDEVLALFPGGGLALSEVKTSTGATSAGTLLPAALTEISMSAGGTSVKNFSQPIDIVMQLDQNYHNPVTNAVVKAGDQLQVYSYSTDQGVWAYENSGTVVNEGGKLALKVSTSHLTWFTAGSLTTACTNNYAVKFNATWLATGITHPVSYKVFSSVNNSKGKQLSQGTFTVANGTEASITNLPSSAVIVSFYDIEGNELATQSVQNPCSVNSLQTVNLNASPISNNPKVTMQLYVRCPGASQAVTLLPTFYFYYKDAGAPASSFKLLGTVTKGFISTSLLSPSKTYDFKAVWGTYVKYANGKTVSVDNTATVGDGPNEIIGTKAGATNLQILSEVCKENGF